MKILEKERKTTPLIKKIKVLILTILTLGISVYLGVGLFIVYDIGDFNRHLERYYWPNSPDYAYTGNREFKDFYNNDVNWSFLEERAYIYENWTNDYCIAKEEWNCSTTHISINFEHGMTSPFTNPTQYQNELDDFLTNTTSKFRNISYEIPFGDYGDSPCWTGVYMASLGFHYAVACENNNVSEANDVLKKLIRPVGGLHISTHVTGLDGNLVRFAIKDTPENRARMLDFFYKPDENRQYTIEREFGAKENRWPGQGEYEGWWYVDDTSRDQHFGMFFGYGIVYKLLSEISAPSGVNTTLISKILAQIGEDGTDVVDCLRGANWNVISGEALPGEGRGHNGASMLPRIPWTSGGDFIVAALAFGKMINPDKYASSYQQAINLYGATSFHDTMMQASSYFGNNLAFMNLFLAWFIGDRDYKRVVQGHYNKDFYANLKYHRNAMWNLGYFILNELDLEDDILPDEKLTYILDDITQNLNAFATWKFPHRVWYVPRPDDYEEILHQKNEMYYEIFQEDSDHILNTLYGFIIQEGFSMMHRSKFALSVKTMSSSNFIWQRSPFHISGHMPDNPNYKGNKQMGGIGFSLPYWTGLYYGYFKSGN